MEAAIEAGIATFLAHRGADDDVISVALERAGVEPWLASRLVIFLPVAFGRVLLRGATMTEEFQDGTGLRRLDGDPVYVAAAARAGRASREEVEAIGLRSAEVNAASSALNGGSRLEDMVFSPLALMRPLPGIADGDGGVPSPRDAFAQFLAAHGHAVAPPLEIDARVFPRVGENRISVQVDFALRHPALAVDWLLESFGGVATTWREAIAQTIGKFEQGSVHVLMAGLLERDSCADQVSWETLEHPGGRFDLCIGGQLVLYSPEPVPDLRLLLDGIKRELGATRLSRAVHALRLYVCWNDGAMISAEMLLDNEPWEDGAQLLLGHAWPRAPGLWATRLFMLAVPTRSDLSAGGPASA